MVLQGSCQLLHVQAAIRPIRAFVAKRFDSDFAQISGLKIGGWHLWMGLRLQTQVDLDNLEHKFARQGLC